jgi:hypothetical protein
MGGDPFGGGDSGGSSGSGINWGALLSGLLPGLGSLFGGMGEQNSLNQMQGSESQMMSQLMSMIGGMNNDFSKYYQPTMGAEGSSINTDLASSAGNIPLSNQVYEQMAKTGLSPQVQTNAMSQLQQGFQSSLNDIRSQATPGGNTQAANAAAQNSYLSSAANQSAQLAGESQQYKAQGAQGLAGNEMNSLSAANSFTGQGIQMEGMGMNSLDSMYSSIAQQMSQYASMAGGSSSPMGGIGSILGSIAPFFL